jgi:hypothetical protein
MVGDGVSMEGERVLMSIRPAHVYDYPIANTFYVCKVSIPVNELPGKLRGFLPQHNPNDGVYNLSPVDQLSEHFPDTQTPKHIHLIVQPLAKGVCKWLFITDHLVTRCLFGAVRHTRLPPLRRLPPSFDIREQLKQYNTSFPRMAPPSQWKVSEFRKLQENTQHHIYWDRPPCAAAIIPVTLLRCIFGQFMDDCDKHHPTTEDNDLVLALSTAMSQFFPKESGRASTLRQVLRDHGIDTSATFIDGIEYSTDNSAAIAT